MLELIVLSPFIGFLINGSWYLFGQSRAGQKPLGSQVPGIIGAAALFISFIGSLFVFTQLMGMPETSRVVESVYFSWMHVGDFNLDVAFRIDSLSTLFTLVITGVGFLIHVYSIGYMSHDASPAKFFAYLNLFCFAMLILVMGTSLPVMFLGWEGVGLCSYLLIGYWYEDIEKASAGKKAFVANRVGDLGFLLGTFLIFTTFGTLDFKELALVVANNPGVSSATITAICLLLFVGCTGKSAQIPLYVWLPDAMAGPTPVSALIHAATMVTSGIYLVSRLNFLFSLSHTAMMVIAWIGALTAFFAATIAIVQQDIKKVLAYSTVSQLGYMFLACGVGAFGAGVFHVITHAFFKALLFMGAGSVIHGMHEEQNICKMGGLRTKMPQTFFVFMMGWLAICGLPPFSGFFSKDEILWLTFSSSHGSVVLWLLGALTAVLTAFYMTRLFVMTFLGKFRGGGTHVHESPFVMTGPLMVLAFLSVVGGFIGIPHMSWLHHWLLPIIPDHGPPVVSEKLEWVFMGISVVGAGIGIALGFSFYSQIDKPNAVPVVMKEKMKGLYNLLWNKWYVDEIYEFSFVRSTVSLSKGLWKYFDVRIIDGFVVGLGRVTSWSGYSVRTVQTGSLQVYAIALLIGLVLTLGYLIYGI